MKPTDQEVEMTEELLRGLERDGLVAKKRDENGNVVKWPDSNGRLQIVWVPTPMTAAFIARQNNEIH